MKYKTLTKGGSTYYRKLKILIPIKGKYEKDFLNTIFQNLESICSEQPEITYNELCTRIGTPKDIIIEYYENADTEYIIQKLRISSIIRCIVISNSSHCCSCCFYRTIFISQIIQKSRRLLDGYVIERIHDETTIMLLRRDL